MLRGTGQQSYLQNLVNQSPFVFFADILGIWLLFPFSPPPPSCLEMDNIIKWNPDIFFDSIPINDIPLLPTYALELSYGDKPTFSPIVTFPNGQWTSIDVWMTTLGYPLFGGYHRFPKEVLDFIYQTAMRGKRMRLFAYRVWLANLLRHPLEFTLPYFPDDELQLELEE